jgi:hypothetical protein
MINNSTIRQYLSSGKQLTVLAGKRPIVENWTKKRVDEDRILSHKGNLGWVIGEDDLVIDVDPRNDGENSYKKLLKDLKLKLEPTVFTPSGGFHIYLSIPKKYIKNSFKKNIKKYPGIDFLTKGAQCVIVGATTENGSYQWAEDLFGEFSQTKAPNSILELLSKPVDAKPNGHLGDFEGLIGNDSMEEQKVLELLSRLDPSVNNHEWVRIGMALHHWHPTKGLEIWENWSKKGTNYQEGETAKRWKSFKPGGGVTLGTIMFMAKEADYDAELNEVNDILNKIKVSDEKTLEFDMVPSIRKTTLNRLNREKLVKAIQSRFKELSGVSMPINNIRALIATESIGEGELVDEDEAPRWCTNWVYVNSHNGFINLSTLKLHKSESFNVENGKYVPISDAGTKPSASKWISDRGFVKKVDSVGYLPGVEELITDIEGSTILNVFNPKTLPQEAKEFTGDGIAACDLIRNHIKFICTTDKDTDILLSWLAFQVQYPGKRVLWAPVIQSIQGVGKTFFGELLRACLGDRNVGTVSPTQVTSDFNAWATNVVVNVLEELRVKGHNRYDAVNALKPLITDRMIQINEKGVTPYMTYNTTNYMVFTNYKDALPLDTDDRRWWVIFVPIQSLDDLPRFVGYEAGEYFDKLFHAIRHHAGEIRKWLLAYEIVDEFKRIKQAPMTQHKQLMISTEDDAFSGLTEVRGIIKDGNKYINKQCISQSDLNDLLLFNHPDLLLSKKEIRFVMKKLGYSLHPKVIKIDGKNKRIWVLNAMTNDEIRESFEEL